MGSDLWRDSKPVYSGHLSSPATCPYMTGVHWSRFFNTVYKCCCFESVPWTGSVLSSDHPLRTGIIVCCDVWGSKWTRSSLGTVPWSNMGEKWHYVLYGVPARYGVKWCHEVLGQIDPGRHLILVGKQEWCKVEEPCSKKYFNKLYCLTQWHQNTQMKGIFMMFDQCKCFTQILKKKVFLYLRTKCSVIVWF